MILPDTYPGHWRCAKCDNVEPHVHEERYADGLWHWRDYGYDVREPKPEIEE